MTVLLGEQSMVSRTEAHSGVRTACPPPLPLRPSAELLKPVPQGRPVQRRQMMLGKAPEHLSQSRLCLAGVLMIEELVSATVLFSGYMAASGSGALGQAGWVGRVIIGRNPKVTLVRILIWIALVAVLSRYVLVPIRVQGISMMDTYKENGVKFVNCLAYVLHPPQRGDIVAIKMAGRSIMLCKRIVALPGETIAFQGGQLLINGQPLRESYVKGPCNWELAPELVGPDEYYFVGDNRTMDFEQHDQGRASRQKILGKVLL